MKLNITAWDNFHTGQLFLKTLSLNLQLWICDKNFISLFVGYWGSPKRYRTVWNCQTFISDTQRYMMSIPAQKIGIPPPPRDATHFLRILCGVVFNWEVQNNCKFYRGFKMKIITSWCICFLRIRTWQVVLKEEESTSLTSQMPPGQCLWISRLCPGTLNCASM